MKLTDKELLDLIYRKGVAVGFILMMEEGHMGGYESITTSSVRRNSI